jgi:polar amino acid transport system substrate-binding protein
MPICNRTWIIAFGALAGFSGNMSAEPLQPKQTLQFAAVVQCPYVCERGKTKEGFILDTVKSALSQSAYDISIKIMPIKRSIWELQQGKIDAIIGVSKQDAPGLVYTDEPLGRRQYRFYVLENNSWRYAGPDSLSGYRVGTGLGYSFAEIDEYLRPLNPYQIKVNPVPGRNASYRKFMMLELQRLDIVIEDYYVVNHLQVVGNLNDYAFEEAGRLQSVALYVAFRPDLKEVKGISKLISNSMINLRQSGVIRKILSDYGLNELEDSDEPEDRSQDTLSPAGNG